MNIEYIIAVSVIALGMYCLLLKKNLIKKIIGLGVLTDGIHLLLISLGYKTGGIAPIVTNLKELAHFNQFSVDPLPQALVLTSIVIDVSVTALALSIGIKAYEHFKTLNTDEMKKLAQI